MQNKIKSSKILFGFIALTISCQLLAQTKTTALDYSGNLNIGTSLYINDSNNNRFNPFSWRIAGTQNFKLWKFKAPLRLLLSSAGSSLDYNMSRIGFTPRYKSVKLYLGHTSMDFSTYTLSRKNIFGAGVEANPGIFRFAALYGKIRNFRLQQEFLDDFGISSVRSFERTAIGGKIGIGKRNHHLDLIAFKAIDNVEELEDNDTTIIAPQENFILGAKFKTQLFKGLSIQSNVGASGFTSDRTDDPLLSTDASLAKIYKPTTSTRLNFAGDFQIALTHQQTNIGLKYKRVDPLFKTLGSNFFQNDLEEITANFGWRSKTGKLSLHGNLGVFRDNISKIKVQESKRWVGSLFLSIMPNEKFGMTTSFSNYQRTTEGMIAEYNDTLRQVSVSRNISISAFQNLSTSESLTLKLNGFVAFQMFDDVSNITQFKNSFNSMSSNLGFAIRLNELSLQLSPSLIFSRYTVSDQETDRYGIRLRISKKMIDKKLNLSSNISMLYNDIEGKRNGNVLKYTFQSNYRVNPRNSLSLRILGLRRSSIISNDFTEYRILSSYGINF